MKDLVAITYAIVFLSALTSVEATRKLNSQSFDAFINSGKNGMIKFYQDWCGHCTRMKPDWDQLSKETETNPNVEIMDVNCGEEKDLCVDITGYPTIKYYLGGEEHDYDQGRSLEILQDFVEDVLSPQCAIDDYMTEHCSEKELIYMKKWLNYGGDQGKMEDEIERLKGMKGETMKRDLKRWIDQRINILTQGVARLVDGDEF